MLIQDGSGTLHLAPGDICICSRPNALPYCQTTSLVNRARKVPTYALPPSTQLTLEEMLKPPWTANSRRWQRYENESGVILYDRRDTVYDAEANYHRPNIYQAG